MARTSRQTKLKDKALNYLRGAMTDNVDLIQSHQDGLEAYMQSALGNEVEGRSKVVMSDVSDTIEWMMPSLMKIFYGGQKVVNIQPQGPEDEEKAKMMEEKIVFDFQKGINGYVVLHDWFKDALLGKLGVVKYWWEQGEIVKSIEYRGLTIPEASEIEDDETIEVEEAIANDDGTIDVKGKKITTYSKPVAESIAPEDFLCDVKTSTSLQTSKFCSHRKKVHKSYLKKYGIKEKDIEGQKEVFDNTTLEDERFKDLGGVNFIQCKGDSDFVYIYECYMDDYDSDGNTIPVKVVIFGEKVLDVEENTYSKPPFCGLSSIRIPHRLAGRSIAELVIEIQELKTALVRAILDNLYYQNNGITVVNPYRINLDDVIDRNEPGAKWRTQYDVDPSTVFAPVPVSPIAPQSLQMIDIVESIKEKRTGITSYNQGLDSKSLNKTATGISQIMGAAQQRMELIARMFAETGVRELFQAFVDMNLDFFDKEQAVKVGEEWVNIRPRDIDGNFDVIIEVGVGTGSQEIKINQLTNMLQMVTPLVQFNVVTAENIQNLLREIYLLMGHKNTDKFVGSNQPQIPQEVQVQLQNQQQVIQRLQSELQTMKSKEKIEFAKLKQKDKELMEEVRLEEEKIELDEKEMILKYSGEKNG